MVACCFILSKLLLFFLDFLFVLIGLIILALGIWIVADGNSFFECIAFFSKTKSSVLQIYTNTEVVIVTASVLIAIGAIILLLSFGGCWGVVSENRGILITYATFMTFIVVVEIICVILFFALQGLWGAQFQTTLTKTFSENYKGTLGAFNITEYDPFSLAADSFMIQFKCCGVNGPQDFENETTAARWIKDGRFYDNGQSTFSGNDVKLPTACCEFTNTTFFKDQQYAQFATYMVNNQCPVVYRNFYNTSCLSVLPGELDKQKVPLIVTPVIILVLQLLCIALAIYLAVAIKRWGEELYY